MSNRIETVSGIDLNGTLTKVPMDHVRTLVITFSPGCPICKGNRDGWKGITEKLHGRKDWKIVWVSRDAVGVTREYFDKNPVDGIILAEPPHQTYTQLALRTVPSTIVVGAGGSVEEVWRGTLAPAALVELTQYRGGF